MNRSSMGGRLFQCWLNCPQPDGSGLDPVWHSPDPYHSAQAHFLKSMLVGRNATIISAHPPSMPSGNTPSRAGSCIGSLACFAQRDNNKSDTKGDLKSLWALSSLLGNEGHAVNSRKPCLTGAWKRSSYNQLPAGYSCGESQSGPHYPAQPALLSLLKTVQ